MPASRLETYGSGGAGAPIQERPVSGVANGVNTSFGMSFFPTNAEAIQVFIDGQLIDEVFWNYGSRTITFINGLVPQLGQEVYFIYFTGGIANSLPNLSGLFQIYYLSPIAQDLIDKRIQLPTLPSDFSQVQAVIADGTGSLVLGRDFDIVLDLGFAYFSWLGKPLDGFLETDDIIKITYFS